METVIENIKVNQQLRASLIEIKTNSQGNESYFQDYDFYLKLISYFDHDDPKVRKNSALIVGMFSFKDVVDVLLKGYDQEKTEYVKEAYLKGCLNHDCYHHIDTLEKIQESLMEVEEKEHQKHIQAQLKIVNELILGNKHHRKKLLRMQHDYVDVVLTTVPWYQFTLFEDLKGMLYKPVGQGVLVRTSSLMELKDLRNFDEILIPLSGCSAMNINVEEIITKIEKSSLKHILEVLYNTNDPFYFKVSDRLKNKNGKLMKDVAERLAILFPKLLLNSPHHSEIEIVLKELRENQVNAYLKIMDIENRRFSYRQDTTSFSKKPFLAATLMKLAYPYFDGFSRVLDPFCGSGTLLIERDKARHCHFVMGLDIYGKGLEIAKKNAHKAKLNIHFVHKDALRFVNSEDFDEIFTDMPTREQMSDMESLTDLYDRFFKRIPRLVKHNGYVFIYTSELSLVRKNLRLQQKVLSLVEHYELIRERRMYYFFIIKVR